MKICVNNFKQFCYHIFAAQKLAPSKKTTVFIRNCEDQKFFIRK